MSTRPPLHRPWSLKKTGEARDDQLHRKLIKTRRYQKFRASFLMEFPVCNRCPELARHCHHKRRLKFHPEDLCDPKHCEPLCEHCHNSEAQKEEK